MQDATAWLVAYIVLPDLTPQEVIVFDEKYSLSTANKVTGVDKVWGRHIEAEIMWGTQQTGSVDLSEGLRMVFRIESYTLTFGTEVETSNHYFYLVNLPLSEIYKPEHSEKHDRLNAVEEAGNIAVKVAIDTLIADLSKAIDEETSRKNAIQKAEEAKTAYLTEQGLYWKYVPLRIGGNLLGRFFWQVNPKELEYPLQITTVLRLDANHVPTGWSVKETAQWICTLLSIALGYDIKWVRYTKPGERDLPPSYEAWVTQDIGVISFTSFIEKPYDRGLIRTHGFSERYEPTIEYVSAVITKLFQHPPSVYIRYFNLTYYYLLYSATDTPSSQFECTLLCVMGEEIYREWVNFQQIVNSQSISQPSQYAQKLKSMFYAYGYPAGSFIDTRIQAFVQTRNKLAHEHRFYNETINHPEQIFSEIDNIKTLIPLMLSMILGYEGRYWDTYDGTWKRVISHV